MIGEGKSVVLSFDDGPAPVGALTKILDILAKNKIKSEFYVLGKEVKKYPNAAKMIVVQGHKIQNHSWGHPDLAAASLEKVQSELGSTQAIIKEVTGITPDRVRPPYGAGGWPKYYDKELEKVAKNLSLAIHNWDIDTEDWKSPRGVGQEKLKMIENQFVRQAGKKFFDILMHVQEETARDLPNVIAQLKQWGFSFA